MSKGLCNMSEDERKAAINRRTSHPMGGLGTIAAQEALKRGIDKSKESSKESVKKGGQ